MTPEEIKWHDRFQSFGYIGCASFVVMVLLVVYAGGLAALKALGIL